MTITDKIKPGLRGEAEIMVDDSNTAMAYGSGSVSVFATPAMIGLMETAAVNTVDALLPEGYTTVGTRVDAEHIAATPPGGNVKARCELREIDGRRLVFKIDVYDEHEQVGRGTHERFIVSRQKFLQRVAKKTNRDLGVD